MRRSNISSWPIAKGVPGSSENIVSIVYACYNCMVERLADDVKDASLHWYNKEIYTCCTKVRSVLNHDDFTLCGIGKIFSNDNLIVGFEECMAHRELTCALSHALEVLGLALLVIWSTKVTDHEERRKFCSKLLMAFTATPFNCVMEAHGKCKHSLIGNSYTLLEAVFRTGSKASIHTQHNTASVYAIYIKASFLYEGMKYQECLKLLTDHIQEAMQTSPIPVSVTVANMYNLIACCHAQEGQIHTAFVYYRKALQCHNGHAACYISNASTAYGYIGQTATSAAMSDLLASALDAKLEIRDGEKILTVGYKQDLQVATTAGMSAWGRPRQDLDLPRGLYVAANRNLRAGRLDGALQQYNRLLKSNLSPISLNSRNRGAPSLPVRDQILAEKQLVICRSSTSLESVDNACGTLGDVQAELQRRVHRLETCCENLQQSTDLTHNLEEFIHNAKKLVGYISYVLCYIRHILRNTEENHLLSALGLLKSWTPKIYALPELKRTTEADKAFLPDAEVIVNCLNGIQAKLLLNKAILMAVTVSEKEDIFKVLQTIFQFSSHDIEIRWSVTLLLWKLGRRGEACKMWMRTRGLNFDITNAEVGE